MRSRSKFLIISLFMMLTVTACSNPDTYWGEGVGVGDENIISYEVCRQRVNETVRKHGYKYVVVLDEPDEFIGNLVNKSTGTQTRYTLSCRRNSNGLYIGFVDLPPDGMN